MIVLQIWWEMVQDKHIVLDAVGTVPIVGEAADVLSGVIYFMEGDYVNGYLSLSAAAMPLAGDALKYSFRAARAFVKGRKIIPYAADFATQMDKVFEFLRTASTSTDDFLEVYTNLNNLAIKYGDEAQAALVLLSKNADSQEQFISIVKKLKDWEKAGGGNVAAFFTDVVASSDLAKALAKDGELVNAWKVLDDLGEDIIPASLRTDPNFLGKFDDVPKNNNLGLDADGVSDLLKSPSTKVDAVTGQPLKWDNPDGVLDAIRRTSDSGVDGVSINHKKFPTPGDGSDPFVLKNAKQYQAEANGDAGLSFDKGGRSFDYVTADGKLVDRKYGNGSSVFNADGTVHNQSRAQSIIDQGRAQVSAADGTPIKWEVSTELGADGIQDLFDAQVPLIDIEVVHVPQQTIIN